MAVTATTLDREKHRRDTVNCFHCGTPCRSASFTEGEKSFCCQGCLTVFELLTESGLGDFYEIAASAGIRIKATRADQFRYLDGPGVRERLVSFQDERITRVTFLIPAIHCVACVWLLENLFTLRPGIGESQVHFPRKEVTITFENAAVKLSDVVALLASLGYEPELKLSDAEASPRKRISRRLWLQLGLAGFAFGNLMLFSIAGYFGFDAFTGPALQQLVGYLGIALATPVVAYSALDYWRTAWVTLQQRRLAIEVPIAAGIAALYAQSAFAVVSGRGDGYFDSLCGLIFFLLCGRVFQQKTFDRLSFERDYKSFFPLSVARLERPSPGRLLHDAGGARPDIGAPVEEHVALAQLRVGDTLVIRNGELIPADARLFSDQARIDYSFITGESDPVEKVAGDYLYAGGRQIGGAIEVEMLRPVSQSHLTSLWNQDAFRKDRLATFETLVNAYSYRFTMVVMAIAAGAAMFWAFRDPGKSLKAFTSVLIVACPCALALAAPFTLGTAIRVLSRRNIFVKNTEVIESLARIDSVVFDKTGTLTAAGAQSVRFEGDPLDEAEQRCLHSLARQSTHPLAVRVAESLGADFTEPVRSFVEHAGSGLEGLVAGVELLMGSAPWLEARGITLPPRLESEGADTALKGSTVHVAMDGRYRGCFRLNSALRNDIDEMVRRLSAKYDLALLSGDNERERDIFAALFGNRTRFNQSPLNKLEFIHRRQRLGRTVMMVGDGLNDAGALKQSDVGVAVVESISAFSPASDIIMGAGMVAQLGAVLRFSKSAVKIVRLSFLMSGFYNVIGISIAASGFLSPVVCAILMPLSSISVVAFACGATAWAGRKLPAAPAVIRCARRSMANPHPAIVKAT